LPFLIQGKNVEDACKKAGITKTTYYEWIKDESFMAVYDRMQNDLLFAAMTELQGYAGKAVKKLVAMLDKSTPSLRRLVCNDILDRVIKHNEQQEIVERLEKLERIIENNDLARHRKVS
jgi:ACT domain-containing protein